MDRIIKEASRFARETGTDGGDKLDGISRIREINTLAESLMQMEADTERRIREVARLTGEKERIGAELGIAAGIQAEMLPKNLKGISNRRDFSLYARMLPANEVGGDFYDYYLLDKELLAFVIGDVSGKGVPASLFMVLTKTLLKDNLIMTGSLKSAMKHTNNVLLENSGGDMFVTCFFAVFDTVSGELTYVNAGHNPPIITSADGSAAFLEDDSNQLVLSGWPDYEYKEKTLKLKPGDGILLYTDGVTEARNSSGEFFEADRLLSWVNGTGGKYEDAEEYVKALASYMDAFRGNAERSDDMTMLRLVLSING
jgi:sigma-B regulation protein RsbU (phosphoserine phosphatase)